MGMPLRITFKDKDYNFQVANKEPITKATTRIPIILQGHSLGLIKGLKGWALEGQDENVDAALIQAIGRAIELRFRL